MAGTLADQPEGIPETQVAANPESVAYSYWGPRTNAALQLSESLAELHPALGQFAGAYSHVEELKAEEATRQAALKTQGASFAEAVQKGLIEPTQNPWWIQAYNRNSAQVRTQNEVAQLNAQAATWAEQNDPAAFQKKYSEALSKIGAGYTGPDAQEGFNAAAGPALQQAIASNQAYNVERIKTERQQDLSSLAGKAIQDSIRARGGRADPNDVQTRLAPLKQEWLGTGGTTTDWNKVVLGAVSDAAFVTHDAGVIDLAKKLPNGGGGSLYDIEGAARDMEQGRYRIMGENRDIARQGMMAMEFNEYQSTRKAEGLLFDKYGPGIYSGKFDEQQAIDMLTQQGFQTPDIAKAFQSIASTANSVRELAADRTGAWSASPQGAQALNSMYGEAQRQGWSEGLENSIGYHLMHGDISDQTANDIRSKALSRTNAQATANPLTQAQAVRRRGQIIQQWTGARDDTLKIVSKAEQLGRQHGASALSPEEQDDLQNTTIDAVSDFIEANPKAFKQAGAVAAKTAGEWFIQRQKRLDAQQGQPKGAK